MKILVTGEGAREHAIISSLSKNKKVNKIYASSGNAGTESVDKCENIQLNSIDDILSFVKKEKIDLTVVGSEDMLVKGIVDLFDENSIKIFGPNKASAVLEGSKAYAKDFMKKYGIKTADYQIFSSEKEAKKYLEKCNYPIVIKASGLALGKGVIICENEEDAKNAVDKIMVEKIFKEAGEEIVIEEYLKGVEASILSITDGDTIIPFISAKDHKKIGNNDTGPNTGGMGAIAPNPYMTKEVYEKFTKDILNPTLNGMKKENMDFAGIIFFGLMINEKGVYLLEYNMRMGDPETQVVLSLLETDFLSIIESSLNKELKNIEIKWTEKYAASVVLASGGYPEKYKKGYKITGLEKIKNTYFIAGAKKEENGDIITSGGRVLNVVATGDTLKKALDKVYSDIENVHFTDMYFRKDIGKIHK